MSTQLLSRGAGIGVRTSQSSYTGRGKTPLPGTLARALCSLLLSAPCALVYAEGAEKTAPGTPIADPRPVRDGVEVVTEGKHEHGYEFTSTDLFDEDRTTAAPLIVRSSRITTKGENASGLHSRITGAREARIEKSVIQTSGESAAGIDMLHSPTTISATSVTTTGAVSPAVILRSTKSASHIDGGTLRTEGANSVGVAALYSDTEIDSVTVTIAGADSAGIVAMDGKTTLRDTRVSTDGDRSAGAIVSGGTLSARDSVIRSARHNAITVTDEAGSDTNILLHNTRIQDPDPAGAFVDVTTPKNSLAGRVTILLAEKSAANGDIVRSGRADDSHPINLTLNNANWRGKTTALTHAAIVDRGEWQLTGDSRVGSMTMLDGRVAFDPIGDARAYTLTIANDLNGSGSFAMNADFAKGQSNRVIVRGKANGLFKLEVRATGQEPARGQAALNLVQSRGGDASFALSNRSGRAELGVYQYELQRRQTGGETAWDLLPAHEAPPAALPRTETSSGPLPPGSGAVAGADAAAGSAAVAIGAAAVEGNAAAGSAEAAGAGNNSPAATQQGTRSSLAKPGSAAATTVAVATTGSAAISAATARNQARPARPRLSALASDVVNTSSFASTQRIWNAQIGALGLRADALRNGDAGSGLWAERFGGRQQLNNGTGRDFSQKVQGLHVGADRAIAVEGGRWNVGVAAGGSGTRRDFGDEGKGNARGLHAGLYAALRHGSGLYAQGAVTAGRFTNHIQAIGSDQRTATARYTTQGLGLSLTAGKRFGLAHNWFVEPQAGADWFHLGAARYRSSNGMTVKADSAASLQLRGALRLGKRLDLANGGNITPYVQLGTVQESGGGSRTTLNGIRLDSRTAGARLETRLGVNASPGKGHALFAGYSYAKGRNYRQPWALNAGYRYAF